ncbi:hypothetical protein FisN_31Hu008 [Fistulifera solaris]|uniref:Lipid/polyisoprenoid-binding YceI-like domain-containing protein n=1 Tax=Fistulifera solaris TaxID=1519565 RepID=A0A1Z5JWD6_FISSO|nr:hypothetical protein FisN_31Hu008 [Fistulifera solaris]|eukprot:GAX18239.1 hypothetical protein FisN_31Hu008 [Fistulifera solaris]
MLFRVSNVLLATLAATTPFFAQAQSDSPSMVPSPAPSPAPSSAPTINHFTSVYQHGQSGKITLYDSQNGDWGSDPDAVTMTMDYLYERDANDKIVGKTGSKKHSVQNFASQTFTFSELEKTELFGYTASTFSFESQVSTVGTIKIDTYVMHEGGTMVTDTNETFEVFPGDFKFNIELVDWEWCNPCNDGTSTHIDVGIEIKGSADVPTEDDLGGGIPLVLASNIKVGEEVITMPEGYPKIVNEGGKSLFVFRFPKTGDATSYIYDPIIGMGQKEERDDGRRGLFSFCG